MPDSPSMAQVLAVEPAAAVAATNQHYELPAAIFEAFLDRRMKYTCGLYRTGEESLDAAQENKLHMIASLLGITGGERVLDIGCGWGSLTVFLAEKFGCQVVGVAPAQVQLDYLMETVRAKGLTGLVEVRNASVDDLVPGQEGLDGFDAVALVGVIEHMPDHHRVLQTARGMLRRGGRLYLSASMFRSRAVHAEFESRPGSRFVTEGIFGYGVLRPLSMLIEAVESAGFSLTTLSDLTGDYRRTIEEWERRALANQPAIDVISPGLTEELVRYFRTTNAGWGFTTKHYALSAVRSRTGEMVIPR